MANIWKVASFSLKCFITMNCYMNLRASRRLQSTLVAANIVRIYGSKWHKIHMTYPARCEQWKRRTIKLKIRNDFIAVPLLSKWKRVDILNKLLTRSPIRDFYALPNDTEKQISLVSNVCVNLLWSNCFNQSNRKREKIYQDQ